MQAFVVLRLGTDLPSIIDVVSSREEAILIAEGTSADLGLALDVSPTPGSALHRNDVVALTEPSREGVLVLSAEMPLAAKPYDSPKLDAIADALIAALAGGVHATAKALAIEIDEHEKTVGNVLRGASAKYGDAPFARAGRAGKAHTWRLSTPWLTANPEYR